MARKSKRTVPAHVKAAADRAEARARGETLDEPKVPIDPPIERSGIAEPTVSHTRPEPTIHRPKLGRPTKYRKEFAEKAKRLCELGATDADLALMFDVDTTTIWRWQSEHPSFCKAVKIGKSAPDDRVERSLYQRAVGYSFSAVKIMQDKGHPVMVEYMEHLPPDPGAAKLWLTNRRPDDWREKIETTHKPDAAFVDLWQQMSGG